MSPIGGTRFGLAELSYEWNDLEIAEQYFERLKSVLASEEQEVICSGEGQAADGSLALSTTNNLRSAAGAEQSNKEKELLLLFENGKLLNQLIKVNYLLYTIRCSLARYFWYEETRWFLRCLWYKYS